MVTLTKLLCEAKISRSGGRQTVGILTVAGLVATGQFE